MVRCVCTSEDVKRNRLSTKLHPSSRRMAIKPLGRQRFGHWKSLHYVFLLILLLQRFPATATANTTAAAPKPLTNTTTSGKTITLSKTPTLTPGTAKNATTIAAGTVTNATTIAAGTAKNATTITAGTAKNATTITAGTVTNATTIAAGTVTNATTIAAGTAKNATTIAAGTAKNATTIAAGTAKNATTIAAGTAKNATTIVAGTVTNATTIAAGTATNATTIVAGTVTNATTIAAGNVTNATTIAAGTATNATTIVAGTVTNATTIAAGNVTNATTIAAGTATNATTIAAGTATNATTIAAGNVTNATTIAAGNVTNATTIAAGTATNATTIAAGTTTNATTIATATNATTTATDETTTNETTADTPITETNATTAETTSAGITYYNITYYSITQDPFTENTTSSNTTVETPEPSSPPNTTVTRAVSMTPMSCDFHLSCNQTFYWMQISGKKGLQVKDVETLLKELVTCAQKYAIPTNNISATGNQSSLVESKDVSCDTQNETIICEVIMKLLAPVDVCCIRETVMTAGKSINATVEGDIERVGVCFPHGSNHSCNETENQTCSFNTPLSCNCSSSCNSSETYYSITVKMNAYSLQPSFDQLFSSTCNSKVSVCETLHAFKSIYLDFRVVHCSEGMPQSCTIIVKLNTNTIDVCYVKTAVEAIITQQNISMDIYDVTRVAICSQNDSNPIKGNITWMSLPVSFADFCSNSLKSLVTCSEGSSVAVLLNERCNSTPTFLNSTTTPPNSTTSPLSISTLPTTTRSSYTTPLSSTESTNTTIDAGGLLNMTANASSLNSAQVDSILTQLETLLSGPNVSVALANTSVGIVNNLLDVPAAVIASFSKRASGIVDTVGLKLVVSGGSETLLTSSLALAVKKVDGAKFEETSFSITDPSNLQIRGDSRLAQDRSVALGSITLPASLTGNLSTQEQQLASRVQFNFYQKSTFFQDKALGKRRLISGILSTSVANLSISNLQNNVSITLQNTEALVNSKHVVSCVFWDFGLNDGAGGWNSIGCSKKVNSTKQETQCSCNHLTSFGVLLDITQNAQDPLQTTILTYITYIGCGISAIFLSITLLTYLAFGKLRKDIPSKILIHLCLALLLLNMVFLVDAWLAQYPDIRGLCISTAFFLHYFLLASFTWMAMEAVHMYLALVKVFNTYISRFMIKIGFAGWGIPLVVVIIVISTNNVGNNYGLKSYGNFTDGTQDQFCWITNEIVFYVTVVGYYCIVFLLNLTMFIVVMIQLFRIKRQNPQNMQNRSYWQEMRSIAGLTVLLGLTWGFGLFAWGPVNLAFMYLFAIFNTLQGLFIFVFHCAMKENVRRQWRTYLCCGKLRLPENSEWSRTATQKIKKASKKRPSSNSTQSNHSSSSFLNNDSIASDVPIGISNPIDDRIITASEEPSSDVVLNEINNKQRNKKSY